MTTTTPVSIHDRDVAFAALTTAFGADPVLRWFFPDAATYLVAFPAAVQLLGGPAFETGTAAVTEDHAGVALWTAPGTELDGEALAALVETTVPAARHADVFAVLQAMEAHHPAGEHWYLPFIGVDPAHQGRGLGSGLLRRGLGRVDDDRLPAYLEASSPRNRALYERHGFAVTGEVRVGDSPPLWPMSRPAHLDSA